MQINLSESESLSIKNQYIVKLLDKNLTTSSFKFSLVHALHIHLVIQ